MDYDEDDIDDDNTILAEGGERYITPDEFANTVSPIQYLPGVLVTSICTSILCYVYVHDHRLRNYNHQVRYKKL